MGMGLGKEAKEREGIGMGLGKETEEGGGASLVMAPPRTVVKMGDAKKIWKEKPVPPIRLEDVISPDDPLQSMPVDDPSQSSRSSLWQVYALGTFLLSRWIWARWQERRNRGSNDSGTGDN